MRGTERSGVGDSALVSENYYCGGWSSRSDLERLGTRLLLIYQKLSYKAKLIKISCSGL